MWDKLSVATLLSCMVLWVGSDSATRTYILLSRRHGMPSRAEPALGRMCAADMVEHSGMIAMLRLRGGASARPRTPPKRSTGGGTDGVTKKSTRNKKMPKRGREKVCLFCLRTTDLPSYHLFESLNTNTLHAHVHFLPLSDVCVCEKQGERERETEREYV